MELGLKRKMYLKGFFILNKMDEAEKKRERKKEINRRYHLRHYVPVARPVVIRVSKKKGAKTPFNIIVEGMKQLVF